MKIDIKKNGKKVGEHTVNVTKSHGPSLMVILIVLKAMGILKWSWFWTIAFPILLPFMFIGVLLSIVLVVFLLFVLGLLIHEGYRRLTGKRKRRMF